MSNPAKPVAPRPLSEETLSAVTGGNRDEGGGTLPGEQPGQPTVHGGGDFQTWFGTSGDDTIEAGDGTDIVLAGRGDDLVSLGGGDDRTIWSPTLGNDTVDGGDGRDLLEIRNWEGSLEELLAAIQLDPGSPAPQIVDGIISLAGVSGTLTLGDSELRFSNLETLVVVN